MHLFSLTGVGGYLRAREQRLYRVSYQVLGQVEYDGFGSGTPIRVGGDAGLMQGRRQFFWLSLRMTWYEGPN